MGQRILALELAGDRVRGAAADRTWKTLELAGVYEEARAEGEADLSGALTRLVAAAGRPDIALSAMPGEFVAKRLLTLPFKDQRRLRQVVPFALEEHLPFPVDDAVVAFARVGRENGNTLVAAAFVRRSQMRDHLALLARAGLDPKTVTLGMLALAGLLHRTQNSQGRAHLVLDIDHTSASMVLIDAQGTPRALRTVGQGLDLRNGNPLSPPAAAAILGAVRQTLLAHTLEEAAPDLILTGPGASTPALRDQLADTLSITVRDVHDFDCSSLIGGSRAEPLRFAPCLAMLLGEAPVQPLELLNFRSGEFAFSGRSVAVAPLRVAATLAGIAAGLALLHFALGIYAGMNRLDAVDRAIVAAARPAIGEQDPAHARAILESKIGGLRKHLRMMGENLGYDSPLDVLAALSTSIPVGLPVQVSDLTIDESGLELDGTADSFATVDQVKQALERDPAFGAIKLDHASAGSDPGKIDFRLTAALQDGGGK